jgi:hypothetical protein
MTKQIEYGQMAMLVAVALVMGGTAAAQTSFTDGNELFENCKGADDPQDRDRNSKWGVCVGYIEGAADALIGSSFCLPGGPSGVTVRQITDVVKLYLHDHPEQRHYDAASLVTTALKEKFPCN